MSISLRTDFTPVDEMARRLAQLSQLDRHELLNDLGAEAESQVRRRISREKTSPDGVPWPAWSKAYQKTRHGGQSLLESEGNLYDSIQYLLAGNQVEIGSNLIYAAVHNDGETIKKPARDSSVYFKQNKDGSVGNRFVRKSSSNFAMDVTIGEHEFDMPQRQFLGFSVQNSKDLTHIIELFLQRQLEAL